MTRPDTFFQTECIRYEAGILITSIPEQSFIVMIKEYPFDAIGVGEELLSMYENEV